VSEARDDARLRRLEKRRHREPAPDFTGWTAQQVLLWAAQNGKYEAIVAKASKEYRPQMVTPEEREAELKATGRWPTAGEVAEPAPDGPPVAAAEPEPPSDPERPLEYWEEKCHWRRRGPADDDDWDDDEERGGYFCEYEYDPLERGWEEIKQSLIRW
jgi:hypothetical protein